jgi:hypothetical protein
VAHFGQAAGFVTQTVGSSVFEVGGDKMVLGAESPSANQQAGPMRGFDQPGRSAQPATPLNPQPICSSSTACEFDLNGPNMGYIPPSFPSLNRNLAAMGNDFGLWSIFGGGGYVSRARHRLLRGSS